MVMYGVVTYSMNKQEVVVVCFKVVSQNLLEIVEERHENP